MSFITTLQFSREAFVALSTNHLPIAIQTAPQREVMGTLHDVDGIDLHESERLHESSDAGDSDATRGIIEKSLAGEEKPSGLNYAH